MTSVDTLTRHFLKINFTIILPHIFVSPALSLPFRFPNQTFASISHSSHTSCMVRPLNHPRSVQSHIHCWLKSEVCSPIYTPFSKLNSAPAQCSGMTYNTPESFVPPQTLFPDLQCLFRTDLTMKGTK